MAVVELAIEEPANGAKIWGAAAAGVRMRGHAVTPGSRPLFYKWYSSLNVPADASKVALNGPADNPLDMTRPLKVGSHVLTFAAKDVPGDAQSDLLAVQDAGMAGGPPTAKAPCIVHIYLAGILKPAAGQTISKAGATLIAEAPAKWGRQRQTGPGTEPDPDYQAVNRMHYHWLFAPSGPPAGRHAAELEPDPAALVFQFGANAGDPPGVVYTGALPATLDTGNYTLTLRVEDIRDANFRADARDEVSIGLVITA